MKQIDFSKDENDRSYIPITFGPWSLDVTSYIKSGKVKTADLPPRKVLEHAMEMLSPPPVIQAQQITLTPDKSMLPLGIIIGVALTLVAQFLISYRTRYFSQSYIPV